jgi:hypothetical protein
MFSDFELRRQMPDRNPYLILGIDYATPSDSARRAFAYAARRIKRQGGAWQVEDLNWALHEIEALEANPGDLVSTYRVPANPDVFEPAGEGLFRPPPVALGRRTPSRDADAIGQVRKLAAREIEKLILVSLSEILTTPSTGYELEGAQ